ncbi:MAG: serine hydrolase domain-containing protein [Paracoccaceae bacterium]
MTAPPRPQAMMSGAPPAPEHQVTLSNWRIAPFNAWAFHHVREVVPSADIPAARPAPLARIPVDPGALAVPAGADGAEMALGAFFAESAGQALVVLHRGRLVVERYGPAYDGTRPHILFSVSKSLTSLLFGVLVEDGLLDPAALVTDLLPEVAGSAYDGASFEHVLDMTVSTAFDESYLNADGDYFRYRVATSWNPAPLGAPPADLRGFLATMTPGDGPHGEAFNYVSPNTDLLGWAIERASGRRFAELFAERIWQPMGAEAPAYITVDRFGAPRSAGGICALPRDLARLGEMVRLRGLGLDGRPLVPGTWVDALWAGGDRAAWAHGDLLHLFPEGSYRAQWYLTGLATGAIAALGIHGQWLLIDPVREVVIVKLSAQALPADDALDVRNLAALDALAEAVADRGA